MSARSIVLAVVPALAVPAAAQQSASPFNAATVVALYNERFQQVADINGDGSADAFSVWWWDSSFQALRVSAFMNDGAGKLSRTWTKQLSVYANFSEAWATAAGDVDGDGLADLVVGVQYTVTLFRTGAGGTMPTTYTWPVPNYPVTGVALLDANGDGVKE